MKLLQYTVPNVNLVARATQLSIFVHPSMRSATISTNLSVQVIKLSGEMTIISLEC
jgi:hypothetical protein